MDHQCVGLLGGIPIYEAAANGSITANAATVFPTRAYVDIIGVGDLFAPGDAS